MKTVELDLSRPLRYNLAGKFTAPGEDWVHLTRKLQDSDRRYGMHSLNNYLTSVILAELSAQSQETRRTNHPDHSPQLYNDIVEYISLNVYSELKVSEVAAYFGYNEKYLTTYFKKWARVSMKQYMLQRKMEHAKTELGETNHGISHKKGGYAKGGLPFVV